MRYKDLNESQKRVLCNGCGGKGGCINPPDFMFTASCNHHDFNYFIGGTEVERLKADNQFYEAMLKDVSKLPFWRRPLARLAAFVYYKAVRIAGKQFFRYSYVAVTNSSIRLLVSKACYAAYKCAPNKTKFCAGCRIFSMCEKNKVSSQPKLLHERENL